MKKYLKNDKGLTLIEILAVIIIGSIIMLLISNVHLFSQKQYKSQSEKSRHLYDVTYAAKVITKQIREADERGIENINSNSSHIKLNNNIEYKYNSENETIEDKNGTIFIREIAEFIAKRSGNQVEIKITSKTGEKIDTKIVLRKGG